MDHIDKKKFIIVGAGGHSRAVIAVLRSFKNEIVGILDIDYKGQDEIIMGVRVKGSYKELISSYDPSEIMIALGIGDNSRRKEEYEHLAMLGYSLPAVMHATCNMGDGAELGKGVFLGPSTIIGPMVSIGENTIINTGAIVDHESRIGPHSHICPGVRIAGRVTVGAASFIGIGSSVIDGVSIGDNATIGAGSVVIKDVAQGATVAGVPAGERR